MSWGSKLDLAATNLGVGTHATDVIFSPRIRIADTTAAVLHCLVGSERPVTAALLRESTAKPSGSIAPVLARLVAEQVVVATPVDGDTWTNPRTGVAYARQIYALTPEGRDWAVRALIERGGRPRPPRPKVRMTVPAIR